ncbi:MAG: lysophospholipid acyltransferase family protein [Terriglobales bacterium]
MKDLLEYAPVWLIAKTLGLLPRPLARAVGIALGRIVYLLHGRLRRVGMQNLRMAFPGKTESERGEILLGVFTSLGRLLAEFCLLPRYTRENLDQAAFYEGWENYEAARRRGKGVFFLTAHIGAWEVGSFSNSLLGYPMHIVVRELDNPHLNRLVQRYRTLHGNTTFSKQEFARGLLAAMKAGETVGVLMDTNMTPPQGVFVPFFGVSACTASGIARVALRTDAAVVPVFMLWKDGRCCIHMEPVMDLIRTGDNEADVVANTAAFTAKIEEFVRRYPDQWLWVHRRWKTRPPGEPPLY